MIEIVFSESACGSLKMAQHYGKDDYIGCGCCTGVFISKHDGSQPTPEEIYKTEKKAEEQNRLDWENSIPMGGNPEDVFGFNLMLSVGNISSDDFVKGRQETIESLWSIYPDNPSFDLVNELHKGIAAIRNRLTQNDDVRIWYSNQPDEMCGLYWFMWELEHLTKKPKTIYIVKLPDHEYRENNTVVSHTDWGEISPGEWHRYTPFAEVTTEVFRKRCALKWETLQSENAPLRIVLNGQLHSVSESIYDELIYREIDNQKDVFQEAMLIGTVLGKYQLGIGDAWVANRIQKMITDGRLSIASQHVEEMPSYHRMLRKKKCF